VSFLFQKHSFSLFLVTQQYETFSLCLVTQQYETFSLCLVTQQYETNTMNNKKKRTLHHIGFAVYEVPPNMPRLTPQYVLDHVSTYMLLNLPPLLPRRRQYFILYLYCTIADVQQAPLTVKSEQISYYSPYGLSRKRTDSILYVQYTYIGPFFCYRY
jgi:hypothetical protein